MTMTPLDKAHAEMESAAGSLPARLGFFSQLMECELFLLLEEEPADSQITPMVFPLEETPVVLIFDTVERLSEFAENSAPFAALSGRAVASLLQGQDLGLGINMGVAPSSMLLPPKAIIWMQELIEAQTEKTTETPQEIGPPADFNKQTISKLEARLSATAGLAGCAFLVGVIYESGRRENLMAFVDAKPEAEGALARAAAEAASFIGAETGLDVTFFAGDDPICKHLAEKGVMLELPEPSTSKNTSEPTAPGSDPNRPPILK